jgi:hypothetical protein
MRVMRAKFAQRVSAASEPEPWDPEENELWRRFALPQVRAGQGATRTSPTAPLSPPRIVCRRALAAHWKAAQPIPR